MWGFLCVFRAFPVCVLCSCVFSFLQSLPPPPFFRSNSFRCSIAYSMLSLCVPLFLLYPSFLSRYLLLFYSLCPSLFIFPLYTAPDTYPIFSLCAFHPGAIPPFSRRLSLLFLLRSRVFRPLLSALSSPSFSI